MRTKQYRKSEQLGAMITTFIEPLHKNTLNVFLRFVLEYHIITEGTLKNFCAIHSDSPYIHSCSYNGYILERFLEKYLKLM